MSKSLVLVRGGRKIKMGYTARFVNQAAKFTRVLRAMANAKFTTCMITKSDANALDLNPNAIAGNYKAYESMLDAYASSKALIPGRQVHAHIILTGLHQDRFLKSKLLNFYAFCESLEDAQQLFDTIPKQNTYAFLWNVMIKGYANNGFSEKAIENARNVFDKMAGKDLVSWNSMIAGYAQNRCCYEALELFDQMEGLGVMPNHVTLVLPGQVTAIRLWKCFVICRKQVLILMQSLLLVFSQHVPF